MIETRSRRSSRLPRARSLLAVAAAVPLLASCTNFNAQTDQVYTPAQGVNSREATVDVLNALVVAEGNGAGRLIAGLSNNDQDEEISLSGVQGIGDSSSVQFSADGGESTVGPGGFLQLADEGSADITATGEGVVVGDYVRLSMSFSNGEKVDLNVPVVAPGEDFDEIPLPAPSGGASVSPSESPSESSSESPSESPSESSSESPSESPTEG